MTEYSKVIPWTQLKIKIPRPKIVKIDEIIDINKLEETANESVSSELIQLPIPPIPTPISTYSNDSFESFLSFDGPLSPDTIKFISDINFHSLSQDTVEFHLSPVIKQSFPSYVPISKNRSSPVKINKLTRLSPELSHSK